LAQLAGQDGDGDTLQMDERVDSLLEGIDRRAKVLELGASVSPCAPRSAGWDVTVVDHATQEDLIEKYRTDPNVDTANIEKVDFVWRGGPLHDAVPQTLHGSFDVLIASHVIEHLPDPIGFLKSASRLLHPERGVVVLAVPDKRWCFDCLKQVSSTGQFLAAHRMGAQRHGLATRFDHSAYIAFDNGRGGWGREPLPGLKLADTLDHAYAEFQAWSDDAGAPYVDCHAWHMTPASFELLILETGNIGLCDWHIASLSPRPGVEFFAHLRRGPMPFATQAEREDRRLQLLKQILIDLREQTNWLVGPEPAVRADPPAVVASGAHTAGDGAAVDDVSVGDAAVDDAAVDDAGLGGAGLMGKARSVLHRARGAWRRVMS
jgi:SAM-dependent methyltransferase